MYGGGNDDLGEYEVLKDAAGNPDIWLPGYVSGLKYDANGQPVTTSPGNGADDPASNWVRTTPSQVTKTTFVHYKYVITPEEQVVYWAPNDNPATEAIEYDATPIARMATPQTGAGPRYHYFDRLEGIRLFWAGLDPKDANGNLIANRAQQAQIDWLVVRATSLGNADPVAVNDAVTLAEDTAAVIDVLANDTDADGDPLTVVAHGQAAHGSVVRDGNSFIYTPAINYHGADSFSYTVSDGRGGASTATVELTITPVADPTVKVTARDGDAQEPGLSTNTGQFRVTRAGDLTQALVVHYTVGGSATAGADYAALPGSVTIAAGKTSADITVTPWSDAIAGEGVEDVILTLAERGTYLIDGASASAVVRIRDQVYPATVRLTVVDADSQEPGVSANTGRFRVSRDGSLFGDLEVNYTISGSATNGLDYQSLSGKVIIRSGQASADVIITPRSDGDVEGLEDVVLTLADGDNYVIHGTLNTGSVAVRDQVYPPTIKIVAVDADAQEPGATTNTARFRITRTGSIHDALTIPYAVGGTATNGADYNTLSGLVTIAAGKASVDIVITPRTDALVEADETVVLSLTPGDPSLYAIDSAAAAATATIRDQVYQTTAFVQVRDGNAREPAAGLVDRGVIRVLRDGSLHEAVTIHFTLGGTATNGADYKLRNAWITLKAGQSWADVVFEPIADDLVEGVETAELSLIADPLNPAKYQLGNVLTGSVNIAD